MEAVTDFFVLARFGSVFFGRTNMDDDREWCRAFIDHHCIFRSPPGELVITSPDCATNAWQFYLPIAVLNQEFAERIGRLFWEKYSEVGPFQLCGCESGGSLLVSALQAVGKRLGHDVPTFMIKKAAKSYGLGNWLEGVVHDDLSTMLIDDIVGSKKTMTAAARRLKEFGLKIFGAWCIASCKLANPAMLIADDHALAIDALYGPADFARLHTEYTKKYQKEPEFYGTVV